MDKKANISLPIKSILVVVITQIVIYLLNLIQINCEFSSSDYNILISYFIVISITIVAVIIFKPRLRYLVFVPLTWIILMFFFFVEGCYLSTYVHGYKGSVALVALGSDIKKTVAIFRILLLEFLIAAIIAGIRKFALYLQSKPTGQIEENQE